MKVIEKKGSTSGQKYIEIWGYSTDPRKGIYYGAITKTGKFSATLQNMFDDKTLPQEVLVLLPKYMIKAL